MEDSNNIEKEPISIPKDISLSQLNHLVFQSADLRQLDRGVTQYIQSDISNSTTNTDTKPTQPDDSKVTTSTTTSFQASNTTSSNLPIESSSSSSIPILERKPSLISQSSKTSESSFAIPKNHNFSFFNQFRALFLKSVAYQKRQYKTNLFQALVPVLMISIMAMIQIATPPEVHPDNTYPISLPPPFVPPFLVNYTVPYILNWNDDEGGLVDSNVIGECCQLPMTKQGFLNYINNQNQIELPTPNPNYPTLGMFPSNNFTFQQYNSRDELDEITYDQSVNDIGEFLFSLLFSNLEINPSTNTLSSNILTLSNNTLSTTAIVNLVHNALYKYYLQSPNITLTTNLKEFPFSSYSERKDMIQPQENFWYLFMLSFCMVIFVSNVVYEKENRIRESMKMAGLRMRIYWLVQYLFNFTLYMIIVFVAIAFAYILKFRFFTQTEFSVYFVLFVLFGMTQIAFSFFISVFFSSVYTSTVVSFIYIIFTALSSNLLNNAFINNPDTSVATFIITALVPHVAFHRAVSYISIAYIGNSPGLTWQKIFSHHQMPSLYGLLFGEFLIFGLLHQYLEMVVTSSYGVKHHPLFFLQKSFWVEKDNSSEAEQIQQKEADKANPNLWKRFVNYVNNIDRPKEQHQTPQDQQTNVQEMSDIGIEMLPLDVMEERNFTYSPENKSLVKVFNLTKDFQISRKKKLRAVDNLTFSIDRGQCMGIIGPNSAGKTTSLNVLCGLYSPTFGSASIDGHDITRHLELAQQNIGVCAQYDILWSEMNGREHLQFYGRMKNLTGETLTRIVDKSLAEVMLTEAQYKPVRSYSGGMKRRLSLAIALIGSPSAILLDEPSSGVDPFSRRIVWDVINSYKHKCAILLITHNMDEAEVLCDRICIVHHGKTMCIGRTTDLKSRYGAGYTLSITTSTKDSGIHEFITEMIPQAQLLHEIAQNKTYAIPNACIRLSTIFKAIQENKERFSITDWGIAKSGLEDVLLQSTKDKPSSLK